MAQKGDPPNILPTAVELTLSIGSLTEARAWQNWKLRLEAEKEEVGHSKKWQEYETQAREYEIQSKRFLLLSLDENLDIREVQHLLGNASHFPGLLHEITHGEIDFSAADGDEDEIENIVCDLPNFAGSSASYIGHWLRQNATSERTVSDLRDLLEDFDAFVIDQLEDVYIENREVTALVLKLKGLVSWSASFIEQNPTFAGPAITKFYVYTHSESETGRVFYVGKGTGKRAWSSDRHPNWRSHVQGLDAEYTVEIVADNLTETEALQVEEELIEEYAEGLVNVVKGLGKVSFDLIDGD